MAVASLGSRGSPRLRRGPDLLAQTVRAELLAQADVNRELGKMGYGDAEADWIGGIGVRPLDRRAQNPSIRRSSSQPRTYG
jgi:hypothetical protein